MYVLIKNIADRYDYYFPTQEILGIFSDEEDVKSVCDRYNKYRRDKKTSYSYEEYSVDAFYLQAEEILSEKEYLDKEAEKEKRAQEKKDYEYVELMRGARCGEISYGVVPNDWFKYA